MGKNVPFTTNLATLMMFIPIGALCVLVWVKIYIFFGSMLFTKNVYLTAILSILYVILTYKYFIIVSVNLIMYSGLAVGSWLGVGKKRSDQINEKYTFDSFTWNPLMLWKLFFWRPKTVEEVANEKLNKESFESYKQERKNKEFQKEKEFQE